MSNNWPFPPFPAVPWTKKQIKEYELAQKKKVPDAPF